MKPVIKLLFLGALTSLFSCKTILQVASTSQVTPRSTGDYLLSGVSPDGKRLMATKPLYTGLYLIDLRNGFTKTVTDAPGAGYQPAASPDGTSFCFRTDDFSEGLRYSDLLVKNILTDETQTLIHRGRIVSPPQAVGKSIAYTVDGKPKTGGFRKNILGHLITKPYVVLEDLTPVLIKESDQQACKPGGEGSYLWATLSPNRKLLVCYLVGKGTFVSDLKGHVLLNIPGLTTPKWLDNKTIIGIEPHSPDGKNTATDLVAYTLKNGKRSLLTNTAEVNERNPFPYDKGRKIIYQTASGSIHALTLRRK